MNTTTFLSVPSSSYHPGSTAGTRATSPGPKTLLVLVCVRQPGPLSSTQNTKYGTTASDCGLGEWVGGVCPCRGHIPTACHANAHTGMPLAGVLAWGSAA